LYLLGQQILTGLQDGQDACRISLVNPVHPVPAHVARVDKRVYNPLAMQTLERLFLRHFQPFPALSSDDTRAWRPAR